MFCRFTTRKLSMNRHNAFPTPATETGNRIRQIAPYQLGRTKPFPVIVDVREEDQFVLGHINGAKRISPDTLEESIRDVVPHFATPIVVYCAAGDRCASVADRLQRMGYRDISTLKGGLRGWLEAGGLVECLTKSKYGRYQHGDPCGP
jgi:rhodanese-related sulfurtransferase